MLLASQLVTGGLAEGMHRTICSEGSKKVGFKGSERSVDNVRYHFVFDASPDVAAFNGCFTARPRCASPVSSAKPTSGPSARRRSPSAYIPRRQLCVALFRTQAALLFTITDDVPWAQTTPPAHPPTAFSEKGRKAESKQCTATQQSRLGANDRCISCIASKFVKISTTTLPLPCTTLCKSLSFDLPASASPSCSESSSHRYSANWMM